MPAVTSSRLKIAAVLAGGQCRLTAVRKLPPPQDNSAFFPGRAQMPSQPYSLSAEMPWSWDLLSCGSSWVSVQVSASYHGSASAAVTNPGSELNGACSFSACTMHQA